MTDQSIRALAETQQGVERLTRRMINQDHALAMLIGSPRHSEALTTLIKAFLSDNFRNIPYIGVPTYLHLLSLAITIPTRTRASSAIHSGGTRRPMPAST